MPHANEALPDPQPLGDEQLEQIAGGVEPPYYHLQPPVDPLKGKVPVPPGGEYGGELGEFTTLFL